MTIIDSKVANRVDGLQVVGKTSKITGAHRSFRVPPDSEKKLAETRATGTEEQLKILFGEGNYELRAFFNLHWLLRARQSEITRWRAEDVDWSNQTIAFAQKKTRRRAVIPFGDAVAKILRSRPATGDLFPKIAKWSEAERTKAFIEHCRLVGVSGVS